jgi:hypothetical protein
LGISSLNTAVGMLKEYIQLRLSAKLYD